MRITSLEVQGFRGFAGTHVFDLDADAVVVVGANGQGKTSFYDAILWALTGKVGRIGDDDSRILSMYSESGVARVRLELRDPSGELWRVARAFDGHSQQLRVERGERVMQGQAAFTALLEAVWPDGLRTGDGVAALTGAITRSVYMQQDLIRQFVDADDEQQRFAAVGELVGAGRVTELQLQLESARNAWSRATTQKTKERDAALLRVARLEDQLRRFGPPDLPQPPSDETWVEWWVAAKDCGVEDAGDVRLASAEAPRALDSALRQLEARRRSIERRRDELAAALHDLADEPPQPDADVKTIRDAVERAERQRTMAQSHLTLAEVRAAEFRQAQVALHEQREQLRALAQLALNHMGERCPVCAQEYDVEATRRRLQELLNSNSSDRGDSAGFGDAPDVGAAAAIVAQSERELARAHAALHRVTDATAARDAWLARRDRWATELGLVAGASDIREALTRAIGDGDAVIARVASQREAGERLALALTKAAEVTRRSELERELEIARQELAKLQDVLASREATSDLASRLINGLREAASDVVQEQLDHIGPLLQRIYSGFDPHPSFRAVQLLTRFSRGRGHLSARIEDSEASLSTDAPAAVLSSSQLNALAVSIFLALNLGVPRLPLQAVLLDDPLQSLDDVNLLGLVDLLRRVKDQRQVIVSTHDARFGRLLARKLRPGRAEQRTRLIELGLWSREGQSVDQHDVHGDPTPLRIVHARQ